MSVFICNKCKTCGKFPFCKVTESKDGNCGEYIRRDYRTSEISKGEDYGNRKEQILYGKIFKGISDFMSKI